jgi:hypothetical protein
MQAQVTLRPTAGFSFVTTYTWSRNLGLAGGYSDPTNRDADYGLLSSHREHQLVTYGTFDLPFGTNRTFFKTNSKALNAAIGGWQMSWIGNWASGSPNSIVAANMLYANGAPDFVGPKGSFDPKSGQVSWADGAKGGNYFDNKYIKGPDPQCDSIAAELQASCRNSLNAIYLATTDANGNVVPGQIVFQNAQPGTRGNFGRNNLTNPRRWTVDATVSKSFKITEGKSISVRVDSTNVFNHATPSYGISTVTSKSYMANPPYLTMNPDAFGNNPAFGYIDNKVGNRTFQAKIRFDF